MRRPEGGTRRLLPIVLLAGVAVVLAGLLASGALVPKPSPGPVPLSSTASPANLPLAETPPASESPSAAASTAAQRVLYPSLGIDLPIYEGDGQTAALGKAAHFPGTAWPGSGGLVYLYGHARVGNFIALWNAKVGDRIELQLTDGRRARYTVSRVIPEVRWNDLSWLQPTPSEILRLQTCTSYGQTAPRFIVEATPMPAS
jgi:sortase A